MDKFNLPTSETPQVVIHEVSGDLNLKGQQMAEVIIKTTGGQEPVLEHVGDHVQIRSFGDCTVYVPHGASVQIHSVSGDASIKSMESEIKIDHVGRELSLRDVGSVKISQIGLDLSAKRVRGDLTVKEVGRGVIARDIDGQFSANSIGAHLHLRDVSGGVSANVGGHAELNIAPVPWQAYEVNAGGNISCRINEETNATIHLNSGGGRITISVPEFSDTVREHEFKLEVGGGGASIKLGAGGNIELRSRLSGWEAFGGSMSEFDIETEEIENLAEEIEQQVSSQIDSISHQLDSYLENLSESIGAAGLSEEQRERLRQRMRRAQERATDRTQQAAKRAQEKLNRRLEATRRKAQRSKRFSQSRTVPSKFVWPMATGTVEEQPTETASEEERLMILKMLEEKKISVEEAEQLLSALEG